MDTFSIHANRHCRVAMLVHAYYLRDARVRRYAEALVDQGFEVDVFCLRDAGEPLCEIHRGVRIIRIPYTRVRGGKLSYYFEYATSLILLGLYLSMAHLRRRYSVAHIHTPPDALVLAAILPRICGAKVLLDFHDLMPELYMAKYKLESENREVRMLKLIERLSARFADVVLTAGETFKDNLIIRTVPGGAVHLIRNFPDPKLFQSRRNFYEKDPRSFTLLYIGTISERYGVDLAIRALSPLRAKIPQIRLRIVGKITGEGPYRQSLEALTEECGVADLVHFGPPVPLDDVAELMATCDVGIYTPIHDVHMDNAFSLKAGEFAAMGIPMVTTRTPVMESSLGAEGAAYIESGDVEGFLTQVLRLYSDPDFRNKIVRAGDDFTRRNSWDVEKRAYLSIVDRLVTVRSGSTTRAKLRSGAKHGLRALLCGSHRYAQKLLGGTTSGLRGMRILTYHDVCPDSENDWSVSVSKFDEQMRFLADHYQIASLDDILAWLTGERDLADGAVAVTFDDGLQGVYDHAFPCLERCGIPAAVFVIEECTLRGRNWNGEPTLSPDQIQIMAKHGFLVGSHSRSHVSLAATAIDQERLAAETAGSRVGLENLLKMPIRHFAYPYGTKRDVSARVVAAVKNAGYRMALTSVHGNVGPTEDPLQVKRLKVERLDSLSTFAELLRGGMDQWAWIDNHATFLQSSRRTA